MHSLHFRLPECQQAAQASVGAVTGSGSNMVRVLGVRFGLMMSEKEEAGGGCAFLNVKKVS